MTCLYRSSLAPARRACSCASVLDSDVNTHRMNTASRIATGSTSTMRAVDVKSSMVPTLVVMSRAVTAKKYETPSAMICTTDKGEALANVQLQDGRCIQGCHVQHQHDPGCGCQVINGAQVGNGVQGCDCEEVGGSKRKDLHCSRRETLLKVWCCT